MELDTPRFIRCVNMMINDSIYPHTHQCPHTNQCPPCDFFFFSSFGGGREPSFTTCTHHCSTPITLTLSNFGPFWSYFGSVSSLFEVFQTCENLYYASWTHVTSLERLQLPVVSVFTPVYSNVHTLGLADRLRTRAKIMSSDVTCGLTVAELV